MTVAERDSQLVEESDVITIVRRLLAQAKRDRITGRLTIEIVLRQGGVARTFSEREHKEEGCSVKLYNQEK
jgi:hypothetical protein